MKYNILARPPEGFAKRKFAKEEDRKREGEDEEPTMKSLFDAIRSLHIDVDKNFASAEKNHLELKDDLAKVQDKAKYLTRKIEMYK